MVTTGTLIALLTIASAAQAADVPAPVTVSVLRSNEAVDRVVDQVAMESQKKADAEAKANGTDKDSY